MEIIRKEVATPKIILDQVTNKIDKMKIATTDKAFVEQAESLEKIVRDLTSLGQLSEIANTMVMNKVQSKLPAQINHDWTQKVFVEKLLEKTAYEKFQTFLKFMKMSKEMANYNTSANGGWDKTQY